MGQGMGSRAMPGFMCELESTTVEDSAFIFLFFFFLLKSHASHALCKSWLKLPGGGWLGGGSFFLVQDVIVYS